MANSYFQTRTLEQVPDLLALHSINPERYPHLLASNARGNDLARYDILFAFPQHALTVEQSGDFLQQLDDQFHAEQVPQQNSELPFYGGWLLYLGYELAAEIEPGLQLPRARDGLPVAHMVRIPAAIVVDHQLRQATLVWENDTPDLAAQMLDDIARLTPQTAHNYQQTVAIGELNEDDARAYLQQVEQIKHYIVEGDVFQVNLSRAWHTELVQPVNHASIYRRLSQSNPGPFNALLSWGDRAIISSSPERLVEVRGRRVQTRPIAGTRPRSASDNEDRALSAELLGHPKERAEHIMLIDLERNDLGRICRAGSVEVSELMALESYQHVHHIVSNVRGELRDDVTPAAVIRAVFPGGTITGCPKVRCMEILAELEQTGRGAYTGSLGYLNRDGSMDLNILIRTLVRNGEQIRFRAGGGIVADSSPQHELAETRAKAKGLIMALTTPKSVN